MNINTLINNPACVQYDTDAVTGQCIRPGHSLHILMTPSAVPQGMSYNEYMWGYASWFSTEIHESRAQALLKLAIAMAAEGIAEHTYLEFQSRNAGAKILGNALHTRKNFYKKNGMFVDSLKQYSEVKILSNYDSPRIMKSRDITIHVTSAGTIFWTWIDTRLDLELRTEELTLGSIINKFADLTFTQR